MRNESKLRLQNVDCLLHTEPERAGLSEVPAESIQIVGALLAIITLGQIAEIAEQHGELQRTMVAEATDSAGRFVHFVAEGQLSCCNTNHRKCAAAL